MKNKINSLAEDGTLQKWNCHKNEAQSKMTK